MRENKMTYDKNTIDAFKKRNIVEMAYGFTAMGRLFSVGSAKKIKEKLYIIIPRLKSIKSEKEYKAFHSEFCHWMMRNIKMAPKQKRKHPSFGQSAKVLDIAMKVIVYYCGIGGEKVISFLNSAIDTLLLGYLKRRSKSLTFKKLTIIGDIDKKAYNELQWQVRREIEEEFEGTLLPVQYDDIIWRRLNR